MAHAITRQSLNLRDILVAPFAKFGRLLVRMGECSTYMEQVNKLNATSDAELAAQGITRQDMIERIFRAHMHI